MYIPIQGKPSIFATVTNWIPYIGTKLPGRITIAYQAIAGFDLRICTPEFTENPDYLLFFEAITRTGYPDISPLQANTRHHAVISYQ